MSKRESASCGPMLFVIWFVFFGLAVACYGGQVVELPQDQGKYYLSVIGSDTVSQWFNEHPQLRQLRDQTHYHSVAVSSRAFEHYRPYTPVVPCVRLQTPEGYRVYEATRNEIPRTAEGLLSDIGRRLRCPGGKCPKQKPKEQDDPEPQPLSNYSGPPQTPEPPFNPWPYIVAAAVSIAAGIGIQWKRTH